MDVEDINNILQELIDDHNCEPLKKDCPIDRVGQPVSIFIHGDGGSGYSSTNLINYTDEFCDKLTEVFERIRDLKVNPYITYYVGDSDYPSSHKQIKKGCVYRPEELFEESEIRANDITIFEWWKNISISRIYIHWVPEKAKVGSLKKIKNFLNFKN